MQQYSHHAAPIARNGLKPAATVWPVGLALVALVCVAPGCGGAQLKAGVKMPPPAAKSTVMPSAKSGSRTTANPAKTPKNQAIRSKTPRCSSTNGGVFQGTRLQLRVCHVTANGKPAMRRTVRFFDASGRRLGQASTPAIAWPATSALPPAGRVLSGPDPLWLLPNGFAAINLLTRRVELLFETDGDRRLVATVQRGQRVGFVSFGRNGCPVAQSKGGAKIRPAPCLSWLVVDFAQGALLLRQILPAARVLGLGFGKHQGQPAAWLHVRGADKETTWVAHLKAREPSAAPNLTLPATLHNHPKLPASAQRRWWVR